MFRDSKIPTPNFNSSPTMGGSPPIKPKSHIELLESTLEAITPKPDSFAESIYPADEVRSDLRLLDDYRRTPEFNRNEERSDSKLLEKTFTDMAEQNDWFHEYDLYGEDPDYLSFSRFPRRKLMIRSIISMQSV